MGLNVRDARRGNINYLIKKYDNNQTKLANALGRKPNQRRLSDIYRNKKKGTSELEARRIERVLGIPTGWMDKENLMQKYWELIMKNPKLKKEERVTANSGSTFVLEHLSVGESLNM